MSSHSDSSTRSRVLRAVRNLTDPGKQNPALSETPARMGGWPRTDQMSSRIEIAGEVRDLLAPDVLEDAIYAPEPDVITCADCGAPIAPDSDEAISLVVRTNIVGTEPVIQYVHRRCGRSGVRPPDVTLLLADETTYRPLLRPGHPIAAGLLWEPRMRHPYPPGENAHTSHYRDLDFQTTTAGIMELDPPILGDGWVLRSDGDDLSLESPIGSLQQFADVAFTAPPGWYEEAHRTRHCLLLTAIGLGLDDPDPEHLNTLALTGQAVAATIQTQIEPSDRS